MLLGFNNLTTIRKNECFMYERGRRKGLRERKSARGVRGKTRGSLDNTRDVGKCFPTLLRFNNLFGQHMEI